VKINIPVRAVSLHLAISSPAPDINLPMNRFSLLLRNFRYFRWSNFAVVCGMVVATAVLTGAMMVGDSVRESLRVLAVQRLGPVDHALVAPRFFGDSLGERLGKSPRFSDSFEQIHAGILIRGGAGHENPRERTAGVQIAALGGNWAPVAKDSCVINGELARSLPSVKPGERVVFAIPKLEDGPKDAALARRGRSDVISDLTVQPTCVRIAGEAGFESMFNLAGGQRMPRNAWLNLADLQEAVGQAGKANVLLVQAKSNGSAERQAKLLQEMLRDPAVITLADYGVSVTRSAGAMAVLGSSDTYLPPAIVEAGERAAKKIGAGVTRVSSYLVNSAVDVSYKESAPIHYAMIAGISDLEGKALAADEVVMNQWAADRMGAKVGDEIRLEYYHRDVNGHLDEVTSDRPGTAIRLHLVRILPMAGLGIDASLTPVYKGLTDSDSVRDWNAPAGVTIKKEWITKEDEAYWKRLKAAPKLMVSIDTATKLWGGPFGEVTSLRISADQSKAFEEELRRQIDPAALGMVFRPIRSEQLAATSGSTDFAELFVSFSFFLIAAAVLLVAMLFRLNVEQRARQLGLMAAIGFTPRSLRGMALKEGLLLGMIGAALGLLGAMGYTALIMAALRTWWIDAVGTTAMHLHVVPLTLCYGFVSSLVIAAIAIWWGVWRVGRTPASRLLAGGWGVVNAGIKGASKWTRRVAWGSFGLAVILLACGLAKAMSPQEAFLGGGTLLLIAGLCGAAICLHPKREGRLSDSLASLGLRNASRHTARSALTMGLIAFATFALVTVASMRETAPGESSDIHSETGGYRLMVQADIPILGDLNTAAGRDLLAVTNGDDPLWLRLDFTAMRRWAGEDISCLNLTRPGSPTILSVPRKMSDRSPFTIARHVDGKGKPWEWLQEPHNVNEAIPVIADDETAQYILHLDVGKTIEITDQLGTRRKLLLAATLSGSVFQGELLMGESDFIRLFPSQSGAGVVMVASTPADAAAAVKMLNSELGDFSVTVDRTTDILAAYKSVQNTYLATFQVLGSLGLLLGTVGLAVVLLRGLVERKSELAMLAAIGFRRMDRLWMILSENTLLLVLGLGIGAVSALIAMVPVLTQSVRTVHVVQLLITLLLILLAGFASLTAAVWFGARHIGPADLRAE
jgi:putative ABC transport system permease protein